jgi:hypothetical protein
VERDKAREKAAANPEMGRRFLQGFRLFIHLRPSKRWRILLGLRFAGCAGFAPPNLRALASWAARSNSALTIEGHALCTDMATPRI